MCTLHKGRGTQALTLGKRESSLQQLSVCSKGWPCPKNRVLVIVVIYFECGSCHNWPQKNCLPSPHSQCTVKCQPSKMTKKKNRSKAAKAKVAGREPIGNVIAVEQKAEEDANNNCLQPITIGSETERKSLEAEPPKSEEADSDQHVEVSKESKCREDIRSPAGDFSKTDKDGEVGNLGDKRNDECVHEDPSKDDGKVSTSVREEVEQTAPDKNEGLALEAGAGLVLEADAGKGSKMETDSSKSVRENNSEPQKIDSNIEMRNEPSKPGNDAGTGELGLSEKDINGESKTGNDDGPSEKRLSQKDNEKANSGNDGASIEKTQSQKESEKAKPSAAQSGSCSRKEKGSSELNKGGGTLL